MRCAAGIIECSQTSSASAGDDWRCDCERCLNFSGSRVARVDGQRAAFFIISGASMSSIFRLHSKEYRQEGMPTPERPLPWRRRAAWMHLGHLLLSKPPLMLEKLREDQPARLAEHAGHDLA